MGEEWQEGEEMLEVNMTLKRGCNGSSWRSMMHLSD